MKRSVVVLAAILGAVCAIIARGELPPVPVPVGNPITPEKALLGKMLFWDEQLSSDNTVACGTCHRPASAGADPRLGIHPGPDGLFGVVDPVTGLDDVIGSPGVIQADSAGNYNPDPLFGLVRQVTGRSANPAIMAMYAPDLFWDGRAPDEFSDPLDGGTQILAAFAGLESQAVQPILSGTEMAHDGRTWSEVTEKLQAVRPMALATDLPPDIESALATNPLYADLFEDAFGDADITPARIGMAIATYERTLVPDQTPFDLGTMTANQQNGFTLLQNNTVCFNCHTPPAFTDDEFHNIGLRPAADDEGHRAVTGSAADFGRFKTPTLRNLGLKPSMMHVGWVTDIQDAIDFYNAGTQATGHTQFTENQDSIPPGGGNYNMINMPAFFQTNVIDFIGNALTDPRVASETFPFDRPTLHSEQSPPNPQIVGEGTPGGGGITPRMLATVPPDLGSTDFKLGLADALGGAEAFLAVSGSPPIDGVLVDPDELYGPFILPGATFGAGYATWHGDDPDDPALIGETRFAQWQVTDAGAPGGVARTPVAQFTIFCHRGCPCTGDVDGDSNVGIVDFLAVLAQWGPCGAVCPADFDHDGVVGILDFLVLLGAWGPCP